MNRVTEGAGRLVRHISPLRVVRRLALALSNWRRRRFRQIDYVVLHLPPRLPALPIPRSWLERRILGDPPLSLYELARVCQRLGQDPRPTGLLLYLRGLHMPLADLQTLREILQDLRRRGKRVVCFAHAYDLPAYYLASVADQVVLQPGGELHTLGLLSSAVFLGDALAALGLRAEAVAISPYKTAFDPLTRSHISPHMREQLDWLLDSRYEVILRGIAEGRGMAPDAVRAMVDGAPYLDREALDAGYVDALLTEEDLPAHLQAAHFVPWERAVRLLPRPWQDPAQRAVAVLPLSGLMVEGESRRPPVDIPIPILGEERLGSVTVVRQVRNLLRDRRVGAVVLYVESGGGAADAAEAITSALSQLAGDRPLVACMGGVAASGGYHVATPARWIVAQPGTITGSIGVVDLKIVGGELLERLRFNAVEVARGANATLHSPLTPWTDAQRQAVQRSVERVYRLFVDRVARSRGLSPEAVDAVGGGRVWTGAQALERGLVDQLGGLDAALAKARALAGLPPDAPVTVVWGRGRPLGPQLAASADPAASLAYLLGNLEALGSARPQLLLPWRWRDGP